MGSDMASDEGLVSPQQAARAIGVSESSLKRWCDSGLLRMTRTAGGHRKIAIGEVIRFASENGSPLLAPEELSLTIGRPTRSSANSETPSQLAAALLCGNESVARQILMDRFLNHHDVSTLCDLMIAPAFAEIGVRWACQSSTIYQERRSCEILLRILVELRRLLPPPERNRSACGGTLSGDHYEVPTAMAEVVLRSSGFDAQNLGTSIPGSELARAVQDLRPEIFWLSISHISDEHRFLDEFADLSEACSSGGTSLVVGGRGLNEDLRRRLKYSAFCDTMKQFETFAVTLKRLASKSNPTEKGGRFPSKGTRVIRPNAMKRKRTT
jgi:methanogenic corrinoid protein MtbC1